jgi:hypothetical protein
MHTSRRHISVFSGYRAKKKQSTQRQGTRSSKKFLFVIIRERILQLFIPTRNNRTVEKPVMEKP